MTVPRKSDSGELLSVSGIADLLGMGRTNVYKWLSRRGLEPVRTDPLPVGRLYDRGRVLAERDAWLGERDRAQDERRRASARRS